MDKHVSEFLSKWSDVGPKHPAWKDRVKLEIISIAKYLRFLQSQGTKPWFQLKPTTGEMYNYMQWYGHLLIPQRSEIKFKIIILLTSEYPKVCPRCFVEEKISEYCGKLYLKNTWEDGGKKYIMICHDHLAELGAWRPTLGIAHFFLREVWYWWSAQVNLIIREYDKKFG